MATGDNEGAMLISRLSRHLRGMQGALLLVTVSLLFIFILLIVQQKFRLDEEIASRQRLGECVGTVPTVTLTVTQYPTLEHCKYNGAAACPG